MALTHTPAPEIGMPCPDFTLKGVDGHIYKQSDFTEAKAYLFMFICNHCPYVVAIEDRLIALGKKLEGQSVKIVAICANDGEKYPEDSFENMKIRSRNKSYPFPYLHDETQKTALAFGAVCTPDFFLFDENHKLAYRGRLDDSWKDPNAVKSQDLLMAIQALLKANKPMVDQKSSMGCSIKWKPENMAKL